MEYQDQPVDINLLDTSDDPEIAPLTLEGIRDRSMSSNIVNVSSSASSGTPEFEPIGSNAAPIQSMPLPTSSKVTPELQPEGSKLSKQIVVLTNLAT